MIYRLVLVFVLLPLTVLAEVLPKPQSDTISDFGNILSAAEEAEVRTLLGEIRTETGVEVVVVTMDRIANDGGQGKSVAAYTTGLFNAWGIGDETRNDGIMILVATGDRETRIELGSGYSSNYDARAQQVINKAMLPNFRERLMADGITDGIKATRDDIVRPFVGGSFGDTWRTLLIWLGIAGGVGGVFFVGKAAWNAYNRCPQCGQPSISRWNEVTEYATSYSSGTGIKHLNCSLCGYADQQPYTISSRSNDDDSGSSGSGWGGGSWGGGGRGSSGSSWGRSRSSSRGSSGGGRSSGGGASGKW